MLLIPPPPFVIPHPLQSPPPQRGTVTWPKKHGIRLHWNWGWGGGRHLVTAPPPPHGGDQPDIRRGITRGAGGTILCDAPLDRAVFCVVLALYVVPLVTVTLTLTPPLCPSP